MIVAMIVIVFCIVSLFELQKRITNDVLLVAHRRGARMRAVEDRLKFALEAPTAQYGELFTRLRVFRNVTDTRLVLSASAAWARLTPAARSLVLRHLWRALSSFAVTPIVVVDAPHRVWTAERIWSHEVDAAFRARSRGGSLARRLGQPIPALELSR